jgi:hypothetical protein
VVEIDVECVEAGCLVVGSSPWVGLVAWYQQMGPIDFEARLLASCSVLLGAVQLV